MKRFAQLICLLLVATTVLVFPVSAAQNPGRASNFFAESSCYLWKTSHNQFQVWFDVTALGTMSELGTSLIKVQRSSDGVNWTDMQSYQKANYSQMICKNTGAHAACVTYTGAAPGYYYRAYVEFYAKNSSGTAIYYDYTSSIYW